MPSGKPSGGPSNDHRWPSMEEPDVVSSPTNDLWVANLSSDTIEQDLLSLFAEHRALDCSIVNASKTFAFVYFRLVDDARAAKEALQGTSLHGSRIKIEFARPAKPCNQLWIGGISSSTTKEQLVVEFLKFGKVEDYKFHRDRNSALVNYNRIEDAIAALKNMNRKCFAGEHISVEFLRYHLIRRDRLDHHDSRDGRSSSTGPPDPWMPGSKRDQSYGGRKGGQPSNVLWIRYPHTVQIDEQMLHNAMILFGEIERIKCFPSRNYSFVQFRSIGEAQCAKDGLQGRLFNDPRIHILFSRSESVPNTYNQPPFPGPRGDSRPDIFYNDCPSGPFELFGPGRPVGLNGFSGLLPLPGPNMLMGPVPSQGIDPRHGGSKFHEFRGALHNFHDAHINNPMPPNWRGRSPSVPGMLPYAPGSRPTFKPMAGGWEGFDTREPKRSRIDDSHADDAFFHARRMDDEGIGESFGFPHHDRGNLGQTQHNRAVPGYSDHSWCGIIAKGGTHVCHARCMTLGKGIDFPLPEVINCSARTGLDMLTKHYTEAIGFDVVLFLPDSEEDFAAYTEFLRYLSQKNRAGVAKFDDGTTMFLVPPSDFLLKVLNVSGPERLYGVVLKLPHQPTSSSTQSQQLAVPLLPLHYMDQKGYNFVPQNVDQSLKVDHRRPLHNESVSWEGVENPNFAHGVEPFVPQNVDQSLKVNHSRPLHDESVSWGGVENPIFAHGVEPFATQSSSQDNASKPAATSQVEVSLTPELLATLSKLIPSNIQQGSTGTVQMPLGALVKSPPSSAPLMQVGSAPLQGWMQEHQATLPGVTLEQPSHPPQHLGYQYSDQAPLISQLPAYTNIPNVPDQAAQIQDPFLNMQCANYLPAESSSNFVNPSQGGQFSLSQCTQQYQLDPSFASQNNSSSARSVQQLKPSTSSVPVQTEQPHQDMPLMAGQVGLGYSFQGQQLQVPLSRVDQGTSESDADKNQRYQSTLQFAARLLLQVQQQQQASSQVVQGSASQQ